ncbi:hypothetical protein N7493_000371 [Penicillium malachiteum]|uniref:LicD/FKTN/FKRP nucleotidyltransferase domain-containing protein n=1 Tax=Penicillium malachiteum TaxID=1324776 RepID=A0AAD6N0U4_9EURO|nr:hypothetical protein N7493_000371 [Penicillium malachiteum]
MRFQSLNWLRLYGVLSATAISLTLGQEDTTEVQQDVIEPHFMSVRPSLAKQYDSQSKIPTEKYFTESSFHYHYDGRFANHTLPDNEVTPYLSSLIQTYLETMNSIGAETWIMHGTLLSWWWNQKVQHESHTKMDMFANKIDQIFPWDNDLDVQISEPTIHFLADYYNYTDHHFDIPGVEGGRTYLLEINPNYVVKSIKDRMNVIDGRWIDKSSGLFIDITAVRPDDEKRRMGRKEALMCKDRHHYEESDIFPLRDSYFEGVAVKIPYAYAELLAEEYGSSSMTKADFQGHHFTESTKTWEKVHAKVKRFLKRVWGGDELPKRAPGTEPIVHMDAV